MTRSRLRAVLLFCSMAVMVGCSTNPVTGKKELLLVGEQWELDIGQQNYAPMRQSQGGDYIVDPGVERYVRDVGQRLAAVSDRRLPYEFHVINNSVPNAWALPGGKISINRGLLTELKSEAELAAVLGHEIVHAAAKHGALAQTRGIGLQLFAVGAAVGLSDTLGAQAAQAIGSVGAQLISQRYSRSAESEADEYGMLYMSRAGYDLQGAVELQQTFVQLSQGRTQNRFEQLFASHPASASRVAANRATASRLPSGTDRGADRFQRAMARLIKTQPAYEAYDQANAAFEKGKIDAARSLVQQALRIEPREALFHSALADLDRADKNYASARRNYDRAISLNRDYFYFFLRRGEVNRLARDQRSAQRDLQKSIELLPTAEAHYQLGLSAQETSNLAMAKEQFRLAAGGQGETSKSALSNLLELDLSDNPNSYLQTRIDVSGRGTLLVQIANPTPRPVTGVEIGINSKGTGDSVRRRINGVLEAGKSAVVDTGIRIAQQQLGDVSIAVTRAELVR